MISMLHKECRRWRISVAAAAATGLMVTGATADDFYSGKTIRLIVGSATGGGMDIYARLIARHMGQYITGRPTVIVQNIPGAAGGKAAAHIGSVAPKDGSVFGTVFPGTIFNPILSGGSTEAYDPRTFAYLGSADNGTRLCATTRSSKIKSYEDAANNRTIVGATAPGSSPYDYAYLFNNTTNTKFHVAAGYKNTNEITLAMERSEVDGMCGWDWSSMRAQQPDFKNKYNILVQTGIEPNAELSALGVSWIGKYAQNEDDRQVLDFVLAQQIFGRPYVAPPGTAESRVQALRAAFDAVMIDKQFREEAAKLQLNIDAVSGSFVQGVVARLYSTPKHIIDRAKEAIKPPLR
jgi:tripartite-type tricarboxylate transporter receptor subunit TctC